MTEKELDWAVARNAKIEMEQKLKDVSKKLRELESKRSKEANGKNYIDGKFDKSQDAISGDVKTKADFFDGMSQSNSLSNSVTSLKSAASGDSDAHSGNGYHTPINGSGIFTQFQNSKSAATPANDQSNPKDIAETNSNAASASAATSATTASAATNAVNSENTSTAAADDPSQYTQPAASTASNASTPNKGKANRGRPNRGRGK